MAVDMFLQVDGVKGESADANHQGWIDIESMSWGASQAASISGGGGGSGKVSFTNLNAVAAIDSATPALIKYCASGKHIGSVKISMCKAGGTQIEYATVVLKDVLVTSASMTGASGGERVAIIYSFQAAIVEHHYWVQGKDGSKGAESQMGWDVKQNIATA
ncbi:MAG: type VI secretion system tube protein Hcp [Burkholderiaceae bacterium]|nr:type VI secretion system tube protein Hcp [Burkholderiaceae bacterium]